MTTVRPSSRILPIWKTDGLRLRLMGASPPRRSRLRGTWACGVHLHRSVFIGASTRVLERVQSVQWTQRNNANTSDGNTPRDYLGAAACSRSVRCRQVPDGLLLSRQLA